MALVSEFHRHFLKDILLWLFLQKTGSLSWSFTWSVNEVCLDLAILGCVCFPVGWESWLLRDPQVPMCMSELRPAHPLGLGWGTAMHILKNCTSVDGTHIQFRQFRLSTLDSVKKKKANPLMYSSQLTVIIDVSNFIPLWVEHSWSWVLVMLKLVFELVTSL